jgi:hypothetical protein
MEINTYLSEPNKFGHDFRLSVNAFRLLTRSVGVICLSRYLQHLTVTGYQTLKQSNYL